MSKLSVKVLKVLVRYVYIYLYVIFLMALASNDINVGEICCKRRSRTKLRTRAAIRSI